MWKVIILYREPTYERRSAALPRIYRWTYRVEAGDAERARAHCLAEFHEIARLSSAGWTRDILSIHTVRETEISMNLQQS
jgi:hypothetical protein